MTGLPSCITLVTTATRLNVILVKSMYAFLIDDEMGLVTSRMSTMLTGADVLTLGLDAVSGWSSTRFSVEWLQRTAAADDDLLPGYSARFRRKQKARQRRHFLGLYESADRRH